MPTQDGANPTKEAPKPVFNFDMNGHVVNLLDGLTADELEQIQGQLATDEEVKEGGENAVSEAEQVVEPEKTPAVEGKTVEEKPVEPEPEPEPTPEAAVELKFNIKRHGKEIELDLAKDPDRLKTLVALGFDYTQKTQELARDREFVKAHKQVLESEAFKNFLEGERAEGRLLPEPTPVVDKVAMTDFALRKLDPDFDLVRERMAVLAQSLGPDVETLVDSDYGAFNRMYDRVATEVRSKKTETPPAKPATQTLDAKVAEKVLKTKEVLKSQAVVETPGSAPEQTGELEKWKKKDAELAKAFRKSQSDEDAIALIQHRNYMPR